MFYKEGTDRAIQVPEPFNRQMIPVMLTEDMQGEMPFSVHITQWDAYCKVDTHTHPDHVEAMYCLSGHGIATENGVEYELKPGTMLVADKNSEHSIRNDTDQLLRVLCVYSPPMSAKSLADRANAAVEAHRAQNNG